MQDFQLRLPADSSTRQIIRAIEDAIVEAGLQISLRSTLAKYPGCIHWHARLAKSSGTLEITYVPGDNRAWFTIQDGRKATWIEPKRKLIARSIRKQLSTP